MTGAAQHAGSVSTESTTRLPVPRTIHLPTYPMSEVLRLRPLFHPHAGALRFRLPIFACVYGKYDQVKRMVDAWPQYRTHYWTVSTDERNPFINYIFLLPYAFAGREFYIKDMLTGEFRLRPIYFAGEVWYGK